MRRPTLLQILGVALALVVLGAGAFAVVALYKKPSATVEETLPAVTPWPVVETIGTSVEGRPITTYTYGTGPTSILFVGGMHGGYEWNSVLLAQKAMAYLAANPSVVPTNLSITIIPSANPDGVYTVTGSTDSFTSEQVSTDSAVNAKGRFNAHAVDLNRNFDCNWQATSTWQGRPVSAGTAAFSEPEAQAIRSFVLHHHPSAVVFWHSQANAVYASACNAGVLPGTLAAMTAYATAAHYPAIKSFDAYPITGDAEGWLASINIPAITVELSSHTSIEWEKNLAGMNALIALYGEETP